MVDPQRDSLGYPPGGILFRDPPGWWMPSLGPPRGPPGPPSGPSSTPGGPRGGFPRGSSGGEILRMGRPGGGPGSLTIRPRASEQKWQSAFIVFAHERSNYHLKKMTFLAILSNIISRAIRMSSKTQLTAAPNRLRCLLDVSGVEAPNRRHFSSSTCNHRHDPSLRQVTPEQVIAIAAMTRGSTNTLMCETFWTSSML